MKKTKPQPPYLIIEKEFWQCPVSTITGLTFLLLGIFIGVVATVILI